jgi:hypothetical protein
MARDRRALAVLRRQRAELARLAAGGDGAAGSC